MSKSILKGSSSTNFEMPGKLEKSCTNGRFVNTLETLASSKQQKTLTEPAGASAPSAAEAPCKHKRSQPLSEVDKLITDFADMVLDGVKSWEAAGRLVVAMKEIYSDSLKRIVERVPWATAAMVETFYQIGSKQIYPKVMLIGDNYVGNLLLDMPYAAQVQACDATVPVRQPDGSKANMRLREMSREQSVMVFSAEGIRTIDQQAEFAKERQRPRAKVPQLETAPRIQLDSDQIPKVYFPPVAKPEVFHQVARYAVFRTAAGAVVWQKTSNQCADPQRIILDGSKPVIVEVCQKGI